MENDPLTAAIVCIIAVACSTYVLSWPRNLKFADKVEETLGMLSIARKALNVTVPYSGVKSHRYINLKSGLAIELKFKEPNALGTSVTFYLNQEADSAPDAGVLPIDYLESKLNSSRANDAT